MNLTLFPEGSRLLVGLTHVMLITQIRGLLLLCIRATVVDLTSNDESTTGAPVEIIVFVLCLHLCFVVNLYSSAII